MTLPIDSKKFSDFIDDNHLFKMTQENLEQFLKNWVQEDNEEFLENLNSDLETVLKTYKFENEGASCSKSFSYEAPLDYISVWIRIYDEEGSYICEYTAFYDLELNCFDGHIRGYSRKGKGELLI